jgi:hypothetical protein
MNIEIVGRKIGDVAMFAVNRFIHFTLFQYRVATRADKGIIFKGLK